MISFRPMTGVDMGTQPQPVADRAAFDDLPEIATRKEVSTFTRISMPTLARWAAESKGPRFKRAGGRILYRREDVLAWLDSLETGGEAA